MTQLPIPIPIPSTNPLDTLIIDAHGHIVPPSLVQEARKSGAQLGVRVQETPAGPLFDFDGLPPLHPASGDLARVEPHIQWMDGQGINTQFLSSWTDIHGYSLALQNAATWARLINEHLAQVVEAHSDRFRALATVPVQDGALAARELEYATTRLRMLGALVSCDPVGHDLSAESFEPFWAAAEALETPVVLHPPTHAFGGSIKAAYLTFSLGRLIDTTVTITRLIFEGLFDRHPRLKIVLVHGRGFLPYQLTRIDYGYLRSQPPPRKLERDKPSDYLPCLYFDTVLMPARAVHFLHDLVGAGNLMLGSDFVFSGDDEPIAGSIRQAGLTEGEVASICGRTAQRLFLKGG